MIKVARIFIATVALFALAAAAGVMLLERVPPATIGVRVSRWGGGGVDPQDYAMGFHVGVSGVHHWVMLDQRTHFITYADDVGRSRVGERRPTLEIRTKDNNLARFDVTVTYRIKPGEGYLIVSDGNQHRYRDLADTAVNTVLRAELARLSSEQIYSTETRLSVIAKAMPVLMLEMAAYHLEPISILIRAIAFPQQYELKLREKQLTYQERLLAESQKLVEDQQAITDGLAAEIEAREKELRGDWDKQLQAARSDNEVLIATIRAEAHKYDKRVRAEADADFETLAAEGTLALEKAEALRNELRNQALDTVGGRIFLARQAAENLQFEHVTLNSNDPSIPSIIDIDEMVRMLVGDRK